MAATPCSTRRRPWFGKRQARRRLGSVGNSGDVGEGQISISKTSEGAAKGYRIVSVGVEDVVEKKRERVSAKVRVMGVRDSEAGLMRADIAADEGSSMTTAGCRAR